VVSEIAIDVSKQLTLLEVTVRYIVAF